MGRASAQLAIEDEAAPVTDPDGTRTLVRAASAAVTTEDAEAQRHRRDVEDVERVAAGDQRAFRDLVERYQDRIFGFCLRMLSDPSEAEDIAQDVFLTLYRHASSFRGESRVSTWLYRIAKNQTLNRLKYLDRRGRGSRTSLHVVKEEALVDAGRRPDEHHEHRELWRHVRGALAELEEDYRLVVVLRDIDGLPYEEIAQITGLPKGTVKSRIHRGRQALASRLEGLDQ
jgi:RNA polymerase sigma-70 factor (ECF subfamily)